MHAPTAMELPATMPPLASWTYTPPNHKSKHTHLSWSHILSHMSHCNKKKKIKPIPKLHPAKWSGKNWSDVCQPWKAENRNRPWGWQGCGGGGERAAVIFSPHTRASESSLTLLQMSLVLIPWGANTRWGVTPQVAHANEVGIQPQVQCLLKQELKIIC